MDRCSALIAVAAIIGITPMAYGVTPVIHLRSECETAPTVLMLSDVADVQAPYYLQRKLRQVDLAEVSEEGELRITKRRVSLRLQLAGYTAENFRITGANECLVRIKQPEALTKRVERLLQAEYAEALRVDEDKVRVRLLSHVTPPSNDPLTKLAAASKPAPKLGHCQAYIQMHSLRHDLRRNQLVKHEVELLSKVPVVRQPLSHGDVIQTRHLQWEERFVSKTPLSDADVLNRAVTRNYDVGETLDPRDIRPPSDIRLVQSGAEVSAIVARGPLRITLRDAVALTAGARGESIQVRNTKTKEVFSAEVVGINEVRALPRSTNNSRPSTAFRGSRVEQSAHLEPSIPINRPSVPRLLNVEPTGAHGSRLRRSSDAPTEAHGMGSISEGPADHESSAVQPTTKEPKPFTTRLMRRLRSGRAN